MKTGDWGMDRRECLLALGALLTVPRCALAQQPGPTYRLCWLSSAARRTEAYNVAFVERLRELGFVEGRNLVIEYGSAEGSAERLPAIAAGLARQRCDVYFAPGTEANLVTMMRATRDEPIVFVATDYDPLATGHIADLARPGGRVTGVSHLQSELPAKRLEILRELLPDARKAAVLADGATADSSRSRGPRQRDSASRWRSTHSGKRRTRTRPPSPSWPVRGPTRCLSSPRACSFPAGGRFPTSR